MRVCLPNAGYKCRLKPSSRIKSKNGLYIFIWVIFYLNENVVGVSLPPPPLKKKKIPGDENIGKKKKEILL